MRKATTYISLTALVTLLMSFSGKPECETNCEASAMQNVTYIEPTEDIELNFDTAQYLPEGFDAYKGMGTDVSDIALVQNDQEVDLGFNTAKYLPIGFDAYKGMVIDLNDVEYIEDEEVELDFNVQKYLPKNFDAASK
ncbi:hypothetical protein LCGC14_0673150 [marine sediment metagenome]|uniref:Uncharacterized protein n=2 Tax=root TaxID=1 RepID=A0A831QQW4_9FLAO|nr:hypothetical protein [Pricia sp.]HEA21359.1 hypothetical protein [Pricia antarctica]